jgi:G:T/U-mismatch repair DNA glycosylase
MPQHFTIVPLSPRLKPRRRRLERPSKVDVQDRLRQIAARLRKLEEEAERYKLAAASRHVERQFRQLTTGTTLAAKQNQNRR